MLCLDKKEKIILRFKIPLLTTKFWIICHQFYKCFFLLLLIFFFLIKEGCLELSLPLFTGSPGVGSFTISKCHTNIRQIKGKSPLVLIGAWKRAFSWK